jgi:hypothetical protein
MQASPAKAEGLPDLLMASKVHQLAEFGPLLERLEASGIEYALIGGLAVAHYGELYLTTEQKAAHHFPIYSKDIDLRGGKDLFETIQREAVAVGMQLAAGIGVIKPRAGMNRVPGYFMAVLLAGDVTGIEIMERLPLHNLDLTELEVSGSAIRLAGVTVLDPCTLLLAKLAAFYERPQDEANHDAAHIAILLDVIPAFLRDTIARLQAGSTEYDPAGDAWRILKVLERGRHPLPGDEAKTADFTAQLREPVMSWLYQTGRAFTEEHRN